MASISGIASEGVTEITLSDRHHLVHDSNYYGPARGNVDVYVDNRKVFSRGLIGPLRYCYFERTVDGVSKRWLFVGSDAANNVLVNLDDNIVCESDYDEMTKGGMWTWVYPNSTGTILAVVEGDRLVFYDLRIIHGPLVPRKEAEFLEFSGDRYLSPWRFLVVQDEFDGDFNPQDIVESEWGSTPAGGSEWVDDGHFVLVAPGKHRVVYEVQADQMAVIEHEQLADGIL